MLQRARFCCQNIKHAKQEARDSFDNDDDFEITDELAPRTTLDTIEKDY